MNEYMKGTRNYVASKIDQLPWQRKESHIGTWLTATIAVVGLSLVAYKYKNDLANILKEIKDAGLDKLKDVGNAARDKYSNKQMDYFPSSAKTGT